MIFVVRNVMQQCRKRDDGFVVGNRRVRGFLDAEKMLA